MALFTVSLARPRETVSRRHSASVILSYYRYVIACFRGDAQIYSGAAQHNASAALHKSAIRGFQELRKVSHIANLRESPLTDRYTVLQNYWNKQN